MRQFPPLYPALALSLILATLALRWLLNGALKTAVAGGAFPWYLPTAGTVGGTLAAYGLLLNALTFLVLPAAVFALGYGYARARPTA
jgi:hypothetical protein